MTLTLPKKHQESTKFDTGISYVGSRESERWPKPMVAEAKGGESLFYSDKQDLTKLRVN